MFERILDWFLGLPLVKTQIERLAKEYAEAEFMKNFVENKQLKSGVERDSPSNWVELYYLKGDIRLYYKDKLIQDFIVSTVTDTNSMDPLIDVSHTAVILPAKYFTESDLQRGDTISFYVSEQLPRVMHRIAEIKTDRWGKYFMTKGDNNALPDGVKVRFNKIYGVLTGVVY